MKIGFSFGRCVRDIVNGTVPYHDVFLIVSQTAFRDSSHIPEIIGEYMYRADYLLGLNEDECIEIATNLYLGGRIHQPRLLGHQARVIVEDAVWMDIAPVIMDDAQKTDQVVQAWKQYQLALKLTALEKFPPDRLKGNF